MATEAFVVRADEKLTAFVQLGSGLHLLLFGYIFYFPIVLIMSFVICSLFLSFVPS